MSLASLLGISYRPASDEPLDDVGGYVTDGERLFRVVAPFTAAAAGVFASLEDCSSLEVEAYSPGELGAMHLRPVRPAR